MFQGMEPSLRGEAESWGCSAWRQGGSREIVAFQ